MPSNVSGPNGAAASVMSASRERRDEVRGRLNGYGAPYSHSGQTQSVFLPDNRAVMVVRKQTNLLANYVNSVGVHRASAGFVADNPGASLFAAGQNEQSGGLCWGGAGSSARGRPGGVQLLLKFLESSVTADVSVDTGDSSRIPEIGEIRIDGS